MRKKFEVLDEDGNELPPPEPGSPVAQLIYLLEYGRKRGFQIGPQVQIADTIVQVRDLRQLEMQRKAARDGGEPDLVPGSPMAVLLGGTGDEG